MYSFENQLNSYDVKSVDDNYRNNNNGDAVQQVNVTLECSAAIESYIVMHCNN
jgi:hypothetical protein